jgi:hypothetical protein
MAGAYSVGAAVGTARVNADWQRRWQIRGSRQQRRDYRS